MFSVAIPTSQLALNLRPWASYINCVTLSINISVQYYLFIVSFMVAETCLFLCLYGVSRLYGLVALLVLYFFNVTLACEDVR